MIPGQKEAFRRDVLEEAASVADVTADECKLLALDFADELTITAYREGERQANKIASAIRSLTASKPGPAAGDEDLLKDRIANAVQAMSETHRSWETRCRAIMVALGFNFGWDDPKVNAIRAKQADTPTGSALPVAAPAADAQGGGEVRFFAKPIAHL